MVPEILLDMPVPDDAYVVSIDLTALTWKAISPTSKLTRAEVDLRSGDDTCRAIAEPRGFRWHYTSVSDFVFVWAPAK